MLKRNHALLALLAPPSLAWGADARLTYKTASGMWADAAAASLTCGVDSSGVPQICDTGGSSSSDAVALRMGVEAATSTDARIVYQTKGGLWASAIPTVPVCGVTDGIPQICTFGGGSDVEYIAASEKGLAGGVATLDSSGSVTAPVNTVSDSTFGGNVGILDGKAITFHGPSGSTGASPYIYGTAAGVLAISGPVSAPSISAVNAAFVPDTSKSDSTTSALNTESAAARFVSSTTAAATYETIAAMASYALKTNGTLTTPTITHPSIDGGALTTDGNGNWILSGNNGIKFGNAEWLNYNATDGYIAVNGDLEITGRVNLPTRTTGDNGNYAASTAFVQNTINAMQGSVTGDLSASGSSLTLPVGSSGLNLVMSYSASGTGSLTAVSASGTLAPVDIYEVASWSTTSFKGYTLDSGTITATATSIDGTFYLTSNAVGTYHIGVGGHLYIVDIFGSGAGKRTFMSWKEVY